MEGRRKKYRYIVNMKGGTYEIRGKGEYIRRQRRQTIDRKQDDKCGDQERGYAKRVKEGCMEGN